MENGSEEPKTSEEQTCWSHRTKLEKGLFCILTMAVILVVTLFMTILLYTKPPSAKSNSCNTTTCIADALDILKTIDIEVNPCDDFFAFACNKNISYSDTAYGQSPSGVLDDDEIILKLYQEPIKASDHKVIKTVKKMFQACTNNTEIEKTSFLAVKEILKSLGGWPVVEGRNWSESNFDWLDASYKLRTLGLDHSILLKISIDEDPSAKNKYIYKVSIPRVKDVYSKWFDTEDTKEFLAEVALVFGAEKHHAFTEMAETLQFLKDLQWKSKDVINSNEKSRRLKLSEIQRRHDGIDWLEFINKIIGPTGKITKNDYILFPNESDIDDWFAQILREDRRTQANYVMWKIVETFLPYLTKELDKAGLRPQLLWDESERSKTQADFCMEQIGSRFSPNPMDIIYLRQTLPKNNFDEIGVVIDNIKAAMTDNLEKAEWLDVKDRTKMVISLKKFKALIIGSGDHLGNKILDVISFDLDKGNFNIFIKMLAQATLHQTNIFYGLPKKTVSETRIFVPNDFLTIPSTLEDTVLGDPVITDHYFKPDSQKYVNYATLGMSSVFLKFTSLFPSSDSSIVKTKKAFQQNKDCWNADKKSKPVDLIEGLLAFRMSTKLSYDAYTKWVEENEEEQPLGLLEYAPKQLFWISAGKVFCQFKETDNKWRKVENEIITKVINRNPNLLRDFDCKIGAEDEAVDQCTIF